MLDWDRLEIAGDAGSSRLTAREADLLGLLFERRGRTVARDELLVGVWGYRDGSIQTRTVDVHVQQLRASGSSFDFAPSPPRRSHSTRAPSSS